MNIEQAQALAMICHYAKEYLKDNKTMSQSVDIAQDIIKKELKRLNELDMECNRLSAENQYLEIEKQENEKKLEALEIIKKKLVNLFHLAYTDTKEAYNDLVSEHYRELSQEEYDFLKEVLL